MNKFAFHIDDFKKVNFSSIYSEDLYIPTEKVSTDSRSLERGSIYCALKGDKFDGHTFIDSALERGAGLIVISDKILAEKYVSRTSVLLVPDTQIAYGELARIRRRKINARVLSLTGSSGKTTVKEILATIFAEKFKVFSTSKNNNNHIGVPLTILSAPQATEYLILEHGTNHFDEIRYSASIAEPDFAFITNIGDSHLEYLIDREGVYREKSELLNTAKVRGGKVMLYMDDPIIARHASDFPNAVRYGTDPSNDYVISFNEQDTEGNPVLNIIGNGQSIKLTASLLGKANSINICTAVAAAFVCGMNEEEIRRGVKKLVSVPGRLTKTQFSDFCLVDDWYNANPSSMENAIEFISGNKSRKNKVAILGDMYELGDKTKDFHRHLAQILIKYKINTILLIGEHTRFTQDELIKNNYSSLYFEKREDLKVYLSEFDKSDSIILVKGSRGMKMEEFATFISQMEK
ncbi:MAG: UDP-N-acetylmuramoyl-tripeptide--D-alanyl-D-alanine ligase [Ignavibacteriales bacterium]|nr:UDP-N-acetylmuramoyl-tripeptide--D-alanyl-D-alanine ligase [Ignavibacteriales bacterium]MCF8306883.1 UDP-N-acetylmuramoyl-tripeptide--D-alanyl-D-alanine ligase [Ignavibacteriales bacterium]MCF8438171.1 UDP-N-acetylmuramoyl-tripeptide--D-alanyl-D-alanine ligase [Ignavibacteriales bacterium]